MGMNSSLETITQFKAQKGWRIFFLCPSERLCPTCLPKLSSAIGHVSEQVSQWLKAPALFPRDSLVMLTMIQPKDKDDSLSKTELTPPWKGQALLYSQKRKLKKQQSLSSSFSPKCKADISKNWIYSHATATEGDVTLPVSFTELVLVIVGETEAPWCLGVAGTSVTCSSL